MPMHRLLIFLLLVSCSALTARAQSIGPFGGTGPDEYPDSRAEVAVTITAANTTVPQGGDLPIAVVFDVAPGWHIYAADADIPEDYYVTIIDVEISDPARAIANTGFIQWPQKHKVEYFGDQFDVYEGRVTAYIPVTIPADAPPGTVTLRIKPAFQTCDDVNCLALMPYPPRKPGETVTQEWTDYGYDLEITIVPLGEPSAGAADLAVFAGGFDAAVFGRIRAGEKPPDIVKFDLFGWSINIDAAGAGIFLLILLAMLGGFLLNLTPCVLPVIPLKIMSLAKSAGNRRRTLALGIAMALGVIAFWLTLGAAIALVSGFTAMNQLFQYPAFTFTVGVIIAVMAVGMCGLFTVQLPKFVYAINPSHDSYHGSFGFGVMTAVLSTPCTAPFMGAAAAWAATKEPSIVLLVFGMIGLGMATPYLILAAFPQLAAKMPRTGPASELLKQVMGLLMLAAAAYFIGVGVSGAMVNPPDPPSRMYLWVVALVGTAAGGWLVWKTFLITKRVSNRAIYGGLGATLAAISIFFGVLLTDDGPIQWVYYTADRLTEARAANNVVVMEFTAEWCLNCKALEKTVLRSDRVADLLNGEGVVPIKVDLTGNNEAGNQMLADLNGIRIPLLIVFRADGSEAFRGDFYTVEQVVNAIAEARSTQLAAGG